MIPKPQLLSIATESGLLPTTVEKDYALGWMLTGISRHPKLKEWIFKGGTCLKKCYFETYRFSEDLDFTVLPGGLYTLEGIKVALKEVTSVITEETGIQFPEEGIEVKESINKRNKPTFVAKVTFVGPLNQPKSNQQRIKFDITQDEIIVDGHHTRAVFHPYSDATDPLSMVTCYTINEVLAEKTRAIFERQGTPRDIFDVVNISRNFREDIDPERARKVLKEKFQFKGLGTPSVPVILSKTEPATIKANWQQSLGHQVRSLPPADSFISELKDALQWWIEGVTVAPATSISATVGEALVPKERFGRGYVSAPARRLGIGSAGVGFAFSPAIEQVRFAARNRLKVAITYKGIRRIVEPYSLRRPRTGNTLLYVYELRRDGGAGGGIKAYNVGNLGSVEILDETFHPRFIVEL